MSIEDSIEDNNGKDNELLNLTTKKLQSNFSQFYHSFNQALQDIRQQEEQLVNQLKELQHQKNKLHHAYQQESLHAKRLQALLQSTQNIFNATSEQEVYNVAFSVLNEVYPKAVIKLLSTDKNFNNTKVVFTGETKNTTEQWCCASFDKLWAKKQPAEIMSQKQNICFDCSILSDKDYNNIYIPLFSDENVFWCIYIATAEGSPVLKKCDEDIINLLTTHVSLAINKIRLMNVLKKESYTDTLTGLPNRRYALKRLKQELARAKRYNNIFSIAIIDIDNFKAVNDTYGHDEGDKVLILLANTTYHCFRNTDVAARFGGEEFLIIMPRTTVTAAFQVIERFRAAFNKATFSDTVKATNITVSAGIAQYQADSQELDKLLKVADKHLYQAKRTGRNKSVCE